MTKGLLAALGLLLAIAGCGGSNNDPADVKDDERLSSLRLDLTGADLPGAGSLRICGSRQGSPDPSSAYSCSENFCRCFDLEGGLFSPSEIGDLCPSRNVPSAPWDFSFVFNTGSCAAPGVDMNPVAADVVPGSDPFPFGFACYDLGAIDWTGLPNEARGKELVPGCNDTRIVCIKAEDCAPTGSP